MVSGTRSKRFHHSGSNTRLVLPRLGIPLLWKIPMRNNSREDGLILAQGFRVFSSMSPTYPLRSGPDVKWYIMAMEDDRGLVNSASWKERREDGASVVSEFPL